MIKRKNKVCVQCGRDDRPHFSNKMCQQCASKHLYSKKVRNVPKIESNTDLDTYYQNKIKESKLHPYSYETGKMIYDISRNSFAKSSNLNKSKRWSNLVCSSKVRSTKLSELLSTLL